MAVEEARYTVVERDGEMEIRDYAPRVVAEVRAGGDLESAGNRGFGPLFRFISGANRAGAKIAMTAPVVQQSGDEGWQIGFILPASYTLETAPAPRDGAVRLREEPARRMAAIRYSGRWTAEGYRRHLERLREWIAERGLTEAGPPVWARYNSPMTPAFLRRNEVLIPLADPVASDTDHPGVSP